MAYIRAFGDVVRVTIERSGKTYRQVAAEAECSAAYVGDMVQGRKPSREVLLAVARAVDADPGEWLELAGYPPVEDTNPARTLARLRELGRQRRERLGTAGENLEGEAARGRRGPERGTNEDAELELLELDGLLEARDMEDRERRQS